MLIRTQISSDYHIFFQHIVSLPNKCIYCLDLKFKISNIVFSFVSAHCASFMKVEDQNIGGGVFLSLVGTEPIV